MFEKEDRRMTQTCGTCSAYLTDVDTDGNLTEFHHNRNMDDGFCALRDLFYTVRKDERACCEWAYDKEGLNDKGRA